VSRDSTRRTARVGDLDIEIDLDLCVGFGDCVIAAPGLFVLDEEDLAEFLVPETIDRERVLSACDSCPVDAIRVTDADGRTLVG
jgi:ferredoxin